MATQVEIVNNALSELGVGPISAMDDGSVAADRADAIYDDKVEFLLTEIIWGFSVKRDSIAVDGTAPEWGYEYRYALPGDYLRMLTTPDDSVLNGIKWTVEDGFILTDAATPLQIRYVYKPAESQFTAPFRECLQFLLAAALAMPLTRNEELEKRMETKFSNRFRSARTTEGQEGHPEAEPQDSWVGAHHQHHTKWYLLPGTMP